MNDDFEKFQRNIEKKGIQMHKSAMNEVIHKFLFYLIRQNNTNIYLKEINEVKHIDILIINKVKYFEKEYYVLCADEKLIIINNITLLNSFFQNNKHSTVYILMNDNKTIQQITQHLKNCGIFEINYCDDIFQREISSFSTAFNIKNRELITFWNEIIRPVIPAYLIKQGYKNSQNDRVKKFDFYFKSKSEQIYLKESDYIILRKFKTDATMVMEIYDIKQVRIFVLKVMVNTEDNEKLFKREYNNYLNINHPLLPKCIGKATFESFKGFVIEYIDGCELSNNLKFNEKLKVLFEIMIVIEYLHNNELIYRDLKPNNLILDKNRNVVLIDLDRMVKNGEVLSDNQNTNLDGDYLSPEINSGQSFSYPTDIYSIGRIIYFLFGNEFKEKEIQNEHLIKIIKGIYCKCTQNKPENRPKICELINMFYSDLYCKIISNGLIKPTIEEIQNLHKNKHDILWFLIAEIDSEISQKNLSKIYETKSITQDYIDKSLHYNYLLSTLKNDHDAEFQIGMIYLYGKQVKKDVNKAIHYLTLSADSNVVEAQHNLALTYEEGVDISRNISKAIYYYSLASNQGLSYSQHNLGLLYLRGELINRDTEKAIYYLSLSANQNDLSSQMNLGCLYYSGNYFNNFIKKDFDKALYYFELAAKQNIPLAQYYVGKICWMKQNYDKAIKYLLLSADNGDSESQFYIGEIYFKGKYVKQDVKKAIRYYKLASEKKNYDAHIALANIYENVIKDIDKSIYYLTLAANQNIKKVCLKLGYMYITAKIDINRAIYYFTIAANNNMPLANYFLGLIYYTKLDPYRNIDKIIKYFTIAANNGYKDAQSYLAEIYEKGQLVTRDLYKAFNLWNKLADEGDLHSCYVLALHHIVGKDIKKDVNKAINLYTFAADNGYKDAQFMLGYEYFNGQKIHQNIEKAIHYFSLAIKQNEPKAFFYLGLIYYKKNYKRRDIKKAISYITQSANYNYSKAQYKLGSIYYKGKHIQQNINKALNYYYLASNNNEIKASFMLGVIHHQGKYIKKNISQAIHYYKLISSFDNEMAKNNLGVIYKNEKKYDLAAEYFNEAIRQKNDIISMFNLAHMYLYDEGFDIDLDKSISLLIKSSDSYGSCKLLCVALLSKYKQITVEQIIDEVKSKTNKLDDLISNIYEIINDYNLDNYSGFLKFYEYFRNIDYIYSTPRTAIFSDNFFKKDHKISHIQFSKIINNEFYEGFGIDVL